MSEPISKPKMPEEAISFSATGDVRLMMDMERFSSGKMFLGTDRATVSEGGTVIGEVNMCMGCALAVKVGNRTWAIDPMTLFRLAQQADEQYARSIQ
jgi:hypothetical protein